MSHPVVVVGVGVVGGFGSGVAALREALRGSVPEPTILAVPCWDANHEMPVLAADTAPLMRFVDRRALRRVDRFSRLAMLAAHLALEDAGLTTADLRDAGLVFATGYGASVSTLAFLDSVIDDGDPGSSPTAFSGSVHNAAAANLSIVAGITGPCLTVSNFELSLHAALLSAARWIAEGRASTVLLGAVDEFGPVIGYCRERFFGAPDPASFDPLDFARQNAIPGEGAAFFVLKGAGVGDSGLGIGQKQGDGPCASPSSSSPSRGGPGWGWGYGTIASIASGTGALRGSILGDDLLVLGADGMAGCSRGYARAILPGMTAVSWSRLYGSFPTAPALDLAAALVCAKDGVAYPTPGGGESAPLAGRAIQCLKVAAEGWGSITIRVPPPRSGFGMRV
jgi:3-oxoacyl-[acyl-carrier-protein] synthase II